VRFSGTVGKLWEEAIFHETNGDESNWAFVDEREKDTSETGRMYVQTRAKGRTGEARRAKERTKEKTRNTEKERESLRSLKAKWPGCAPCITISLGKS